MGEESEGRDHGQEKKERNYYYNYHKGGGLAGKYLKIAQDQDVMGVGVDGMYDGLGVNFFNEIIDFSWPPEQQWVEQDCTCEMWDKIRYKY
mmetsp:Transcript_1903/g.3805  ORF Transcript_1903/g.3805 Transcript_1903/m.3805 type:complete len:91 (+) Transcript_1903:1101-1373(+)